MEDHESIILNFGTKPHEIDSRTLVAAFGSIETALRQIAQSSHPEVQVSIRVKAFRAGSFEVPLEVRQVMQVGALAVTSIDWSSARESIKILLELIKLSVSLKGEKPKVVERKDGQVRIEQNKKSVIYVDQRTFNIHAKDLSISDSIAQGFGALERDSEVKSFSVLTPKRKRLLHVPRRVLKHVAKRVRSEGPKEKTVTEKAVLRVFKVVLERGYKWEFFHQGFKISATIEDVDFQERIARGERFGRGDTLEVELSILKKYDDGIQAYVNKSYSIEKVHRMTPRGVQSHLDLE